MSSLRKKKVAKMDNPYVYQQEKKVQNGEKRSVDWFDALVFMRSVLPLF